MQAVQVQGPLIMALAGIVGFLNAGGRQLVRLERLLAQVARLPSELACLRVTAACTLYTSHMSKLSPALKLKLWWLLHNASSC